ncbi:MAG: NADH-quinone oxidoreductase subunit L [Burkholderiales bacterium]
MLPTSGSFTPALVLLAPTLLWLIGLVPARLANARPRAMARLNAAVAWLAFACALVAAAAHPFAGIQTWVPLSLPLPGDIGALSLSVHVNGLTVLMLLLVSFVGAIVSGYAGNYLDGDANQGRFHKWLVLTLASILTLIVAGNLLMFSLAWISTSLCLHQLLMFYRDRPAAVLSAHKKFIASRIGDASLLTAIFLIGSTLHTLEIDQIFARLAALDAPLPTSLEAAALLIVVSAALKSAQFPLHGWLIQVMEAPTPVSALLHAGIVNAGAFLVLRMSPILSHAGAALILLAIIGLITLALASLVMLTQTSIKVSLAWSTTAQMGFMLLECGLGLYSLAMLHLVAHSLYKAHAFLASGSGVDAFRAPAVQLGARPRLRSALLPALLIAGVLTALVAALFGVTWGEQPALIAAGAIVAIAVTQLVLETTTSLGRAGLLHALGLATGVSVAYFALHALFEHLLAGSVLPLREAAAASHRALAPAIVVSFLALMFLQQYLSSARSTLQERLYIHLYNGLYIDVYITRLLQRVWPAPIPRNQGV